MQVRMPPEKPGAWYRFRLGAFNATIVSDGELVFGATTDEFPAAPEEEVHRLLDRDFLQNDPMILQENCLVLDTGDRLVLFDTGFGPVPLFGKSSGRFLTNFRAAGMRPEDVGTILITHAHPDHAWGLCDIEGKPVYPNAELVMPKRDFDFWTDESKLSDPNAGTFVAGARKAILPYRDRLRLIEEEGEVLPGIASMQTPGHTVGHTSYVIRSEGEAAINLGDVCHHYALLFPHPRWEYVYDTDSEQAAQSRLRVFELAEREGMTLIGYHFPFPGIGRLQREGPESFRYVPRAMSFV